MIGMKNFILFLLIIPFLLQAQNEWPLERWTEVRGTVNGPKWGVFVASVPPNPNLPYKAAVSRSGSTSFFRLQSPTDTSAQLTIPGENPLFGDLNSDGWLDVVTVKTINDYDTVHIFWGTEPGLDLTNPLLIPNENRFDGLRPGCVGDINNDGKTDLILTAESFPGSPVGDLLRNGSVYVYLNPINTANPNKQIIGHGKVAGLGMSVAIGDLNNDGLNDLIVRGCDQWGPTESRYDYVNVYWGNPGSSLDLIFGLQLKGYYLYSTGLACFDVNGDGIDDLLWTDRDSNYLMNIHFGAKWFSKTANLQLMNPGVENFGRRGITNGGDMNGDGYEDILVAADHATITAGLVFVFSAGLALDSKFDAAIGFSTNARFGWSMASLGDVNGDGLADIIVGAPEYDFGTNKGFWGVYLGSRSIPTTIDNIIIPPVEINLYQNYPNPFNPMTTIEFSLPRSERVILKIYDTAGREIAKLVDEEVPEGHHWTTWSGTDNYGKRAPSGVYFSTLSVGGNTIISRKLLLLR